MVGLLWAIVFGSAAAGQYISADTYTRYELLAPETHQFKIYYEVTETRVGARFHFNQIREGSEASDESVVDLATGKPLKFEVVTGAQAKTDSPAENFSATAHYIKVHLAHPVSGTRRVSSGNYQDLQRRQELLHRRRPDRFQAAAGNTTRQHRAAGRL